MIEQFPDLINTKLNARDSNSANTKHIFATCVCGEDTYQVLHFKFVISLRKFKIRLKLHNCTSPFSSWAANTPRESSTTASFKLANETGANNKQTAKASGEISKSPKASSELSEEIGTSRKKAVELGYDADLRFIKPSGSEDAPTWTVEPKPHEDFIEGFIFNDTKLCDIVTEEEFLLRSYIEIPKSGISVRKDWFRNKNEIRALNIFALVIRKNIPDKIEIKIEKQDEK